MLNRLHWKALLICLILVAVPGISAYAREEAQQDTNPLTLEVRVGFDGWAEQSNWTPITVISTNDGDDILEAELRVEVTGLTGGNTLYSTPIDLPRGSRKVSTLYVYGLTSFGGEVEVDLVRRGRVILSQRGDVDFVGREVLLIGQWTDSPQAIVSFGGVKVPQTKVAIGYLTEDDLPPMAMGWAALDVLVISDADTGTLTEAQRTALRQWVTQGGRLIIVGGSSFARTLSGLADLTPIAASDARAVNLAPLSTVGGTPFSANAPQEALVATGQLQEDSTVLIESEGVPLVAYRKIGTGRIDFFAPDPSLEPLAGWEGNTLVWRTILADSEQRPGWGYGFNAEWSAARQAVASVPGVRLPSVVALCGFLAAYVVLIGPVNYFVLWRLKKREWSWFTIPAIVLFFSVMAYITGFQLRGTRPIIHRLAVIQSWQDSDVSRLSALIGIWSPRRVSYELAIDPGLLGFPMPRDTTGTLTAPGQIEVETGETVTLKNVQVDVGSIQPLVLEGFLPNDERIEGGLTLTPIDGGGIRVAGDVINYSSVDLEDVSLHFAGTSVTLPDLPAGEVLRVDEVLSGGRATASPGTGLDPFPLDSTNYGYGYYGDPLVTAFTGEDCYAFEGTGRRRCDLVSAILNGSARGSRIYLVGWSDRIPLSANVVTENSDLIDVGLYITELDASLQQVSTQQVAIPAGLMAWQGLSSDQYGIYPPYDLYVTSGVDYVYRFQPLDIVPAFTAERVSITMDPQYSQTDPLPDVEIKNVVTGAWNSIPAMGWGQTLLDAQKYVDASGGVELRVTVSEDIYSVSIARLEVTLLDN